MDQLIANLRAAVKPGLFGGRCNINAVIRIINWDGVPQIPTSCPLQHPPSLDTLENKLCMDKTKRNDRSSSTSSFLNCVISHISVMPLDGVSF